MMILILPFMHIQSGHHQVAEAISAHIKKQNPTCEVEQLDIFSYTFPNFEKVVSNFYLTWIQKYPLSYSKFYAKEFNKESYHFHPFKLWENIMQHKLEQIIKEKKPEAIICTHSFPSHAVSRLKKAGKIHVPIINAYTDFFASGVWAKEGVDLHLVPSKTVAQFLSKNFGVTDSQILISGIPVHPAITPKKDVRCQPPFHVLIAGGNSGLGNIASITKQCMDFPELHVTVLCGKNHKLYKKLCACSIENITALPYIASREEMNELYDRVDAIITKPGGVTVSEAFIKQIPVFISSVLPGQEQINMNYLVPNHLIFQLNPEQPVISQLIRVLQNNDTRVQYEKAVQQYEADIELNTERFIEQVLNILPTSQYKPLSLNKPALLS